ncbi:hypothetical protein MAPG_00537 [Magnaporthiopsis poae ATCC 64411]|uniref:Uncharacterized protein n=1 Tax=Magnaporthiopsis poae (strain ATCC 64411 / 73-15) TaxID=644358 RepID=A0A0C4DL97_MAGP6|nr:hypothetical protein MAPG_00537 [Magnaporthiopsis poae ATCC 64411]
MALGADGNQSVNGEIVRSAAVLLAAAPASCQPPSLHANAYGVWLGGLDCEPGSDVQHLAGVAAVTSPLIKHATGGRPWRDTLLGGAASGCTTGRLSSLRDSLAVKPAALRA